MKCEDRTQIQAKDEGNGMDYAEPSDGSSVMQEKLMKYIVLLYFITSIRK